MSLEKVSIVFYKVEQCGFYKYGESNPEFGDLLVFLDDLYKWSGNKSLAQTATYTVARGDDSIPSYLFDINKGSKGTYLLTVWNESNALDGVSASVDPNSNVGSVQVDEKKVKRGNIAGFATYFWFIPSKSLYACVQFGRTTSGNSTMEEYLENFIDPWSSFVKTKVGANGERYCVYTDSSGTVHDKVKGKFRTKILRKDGDVDYIVNNFFDIQKVIRKTSLHMNNSIQKGLMNQLLGGMQRAINIPIKNIPNKKINVNYEMPLEFSQAEIKGLIDDWEKNNNHSRSEWDDYGFKMKGQMSKTRWLSNMNVRLKFDVNVNRSYPSVVSGASLIAELERKYSSITSNLP